MIRRIATLPDGIIRRRTPKRGLTLETIVVLLCGLVGGAGFGYVMIEALNAVDTDNSMFQVQLVGRVLRPVMLTVVAWVLYSVGAHVIASSSGGRGPISRLMRGAAWAMIPLGIWNLLRSLVVAYLFFDVDIPTNPEGLSATEQAASVFTGTAAGGEDVYAGLTDPLYAVVMLLGILFVVWSAHLLSIAVAESKSLEIDTARRAAAVPAGLLALYLLVTALGQAGIL
ncbi:YIP1 family protein [Halosimplex salinum]|uniref:YIP1 family protein n=1 Tax=Halosimplex salinum TaxID=1710538 RepID=UPI000F46EA5B|nr:YIP1 family protein [Halosimplex salinum]